MDENTSKAERLDSYRTEVAELREWLGKAKAALKKARDFIDEEWARSPDRAHPNDRDEIEDRNELRPKLLAELNATIEKIA